MNTKIRLRSAIAILLSALLILSIAGCSKKSTKKEEKTSKPKVTEKEEKNRKAAYSAYKNVIEQNATAIKAYSWQTVPGKETYNTRGIDRPISLCDIDGDKVPELFFFTSQNHEVAHIYL